MPDFHDVRLPEEVEVGAVGGPGYSTTVVSSVSGNEIRNINWSAARGRWDISYGVQDKDSYDEVLEFFRARRGKAHGFRFKDWSDFEAVDQSIGTGDAVTASFQLVKSYELAGPDPYVRTITRPVEDTLSVKVGGVQHDAWVLDDLGIIRFVLPAAINDSYTKALLEFNGADGATTTTDTNVGGSAHTWTASGNAQIDTAQAYAGGSSALFDGTGDYWSTPSAADIRLDTDDSTVSFKVRLASTQSQRTLITIRSNGAGVNSEWCIKVGGTNNCISFHTGGEAVFDDATHPLTNGEWYHVAWTRVGTLSRIFLNGVKIGEFTRAYSYLGTGDLRIGGGDVFLTNGVIGHIDEVEISKGIARWTTDFDVPQSGQTITASFEFDVPVRFDADELGIRLTRAAAGSIGSLPIVEIRDGTAAVEEDALVTDSIPRVRVVTTSNVNISTGLENGDTVDGITLATGDVVLVAANTSGAENGPRVVQASGLATRHTSFAAYDDIAGVYFSVMEGAVNGDTLWRCTSNYGGTLDTTALAFSEFTSGSGSPTFVGFSAHKNSVDQTIADASQVKLTFGTEAYDEGAHFASSGWTPPAGKVFLQSATYFTGTIAASNQVTIAIFKNGSNLKNTTWPCLANQGSAAIDIIDVANGTDVYEVYLYVDATSGSVTVNGLPNNTFFSGYVIAFD